MFVTRGLSFKPFRSWHPWNFLTLLAFIRFNALAFHLTAKNTQAYDRGGGHKLWGGIMNSNLAILAT